MVSRVKVQALNIVAAALLCAFNAPAIAGNPLEDLLNKVGNDFKKINEQGERDRAAITAGQQGNASSQATGGTEQAGGMAIVQEQEETQSKPTKLIIPKDKRTAAAIEEAKPLIQKVVSMHRCLKDNKGLRQLNFDAVPGTDMMRYVNPYWPKTGLPIENMKYHDNNKCLRAQTLDQFSMPAMNALLFRAIYFADDSGETANFLYLFMKTDEGWKIRQFESGR